MSVMGYVIEEHLLIAIIAALLNVLFSIVIPPLISNTKLPFTEQIKNHYECNKHFILISTLLTALLVYVSLKVTPHVKSQILGNVSKLSILNNSNIPTLPIN